MSEYQSDLHGVVGGVYEHALVQEVQTGIAEQQKKYKVTKLIAFIESS